MSELFLGIDIGTGSSKAVLTDATGHIVAHATQSHRTSFPRPGWVEHDAEELWWAGACSLCAQLPRAARQRVRAVAVSGIGPCVVPCDANDRPLRPAILYGIDTRASAEVEELTALLGEDEIVARGGSALSSQALGPKLRWLIRNEPDVVAMTRRWHTSSSFLVARLTDAWILDHHTASQCDPIYDIDANTWNMDWADVVAPGLSLPPLAWPTEVVGELTREAAAATGLPAGTPVTAGTIDAWAEAVSVGVRKPGDLMIMYGSTMFFVLVGAEPDERPPVWLTNGVDPGMRTLAAGMATSGLLTDWVAELTSTAVEQLMTEAETTDAGAGGLLMLPYFAGERSPLYDPRARGVVAGLTLAHGRRHLVRAALEATAYGARHILEALVGGGRIRAVAVGGGAQSVVWPQIVSDVTRIAQELPDVVLGASYGNALLAAEAAGAIPPRGSWARPRCRIEPDEERGEIYESLYSLYAGLHSATAHIQHALSQLSGERSRSSGTPRD